MSESCLAIAIVDDEESVRKALGRLLRSAGYHVDLFASGGAFLDWLEVGQPDCTILDLHLPGLSGLDVQRYVCRERVEVPCIIITGKDENGTRERVLASGAMAYLTKPLDEHALLDAISSAVAKSTVKTSPS